MESEFVPTDQQSEACPSSDEGAARTACCAMEAIHRASEAARLYGTGHASTADAIAAATEALVRARGVRIGIAPDGCLLGEEMLPDPQGALKAFARRLHGLNLGVIEIGVGIRSGDVAALIESLSITDLAGVDLGLRITQATDGRIKPIPLRYGGLNLVSGSRGGFGDGDGDGDGLGDGTGGGGAGGGGTGSGSWGQLVQTLTGAEGDVAQTHMAEVAASLNREARASADTALTRLQQQLNGFADSMGNMRVTEQARAIKRLRAFVESLSPKLREALMAISPSTPEVSLTLLVELADVLPTRQVLEALEALDHADRQPSHEAVMLFKKLANLTGKNDDSRNRISQVVDQWRDSSILPADVTASLQGSIEEIFQQKEVLDFTPIDYQDNLDNLTDLQSPAERCERGEALTQSDVHDHAIQIALEVARATVDDAADCRGLIHFLDGAVDPLLERREFDDVMTAVRVAQRHARAEMSPDNEDAQATRIVARNFVESFQRGTRLRRILDLACDEGGVVAEGAIRLLRIGGLPAIVATVHHLGGTLPEPLQAALVEFVGRSLPKHVVRAVVTLAAAADDQAHRGVVVFLTNLPAKSITMLVDQVVTECEPKAAGDLLRLAAPLTENWPASWILLALNHTDDELNRPAVDHLRRLDASTRVETICRALNPDALASMSDESMRTMFGLIESPDRAAIEHLAEGFRYLGSDQGGGSPALLGRVAAAAGGLAEHAAIRKSLRRRSGGLKGMFGRKANTEDGRTNDRGAA